MKTILWQNGYGEGALVGAHLEDCIDQACRYWKQAADEFACVPADSNAVDGEMVYLEIDDEDENLASDNDGLQQLLDKYA